MGLHIVADGHQPLAREAFASLGEVEVIPGGGITNAVLRRADALVCRSTVKVTPELLAGTAVKFVGTCTIGFDHVDLDYLKESGIGFASAPGCNANSVGEYIAAALLTYAVENHISLEGKTLGIVGVGNVGKIVARRAAALRMRVLLNDPPRARAEGGAEFIPLPNLLQESDFVTVHVPLEKNGPDATFGLAGEEFFAAMKTGAVFINASRGKVVCEDALVRALDSHKLAAAILDVFATEPLPDPALLPKLFIATPHIAGYSYDGKINGGRMVLDALAKHFNLSAAWDPAPLMPEPDVSHIDIQSDAPFEIELADTVAAVYDIRRDHDMLTASPAKFSQLRAEYRERLEFSHTVVAVPPKRPDLAEGLRGLGFSAE